MEFLISTIWQAGVLKVYQSVIVFAESALLLPLTSLRASDVD